MKLRPFLFFVVVFCAACPGSSKEKQAKPSTYVERADSLPNHIQKARVIVAGKVLKIEFADQFVCMTNTYNPDFHWATIRVDSVLRGKHSRGDTIDILFPVDSVNLSYKKVPKFLAGDFGIWLLQMTEVSFHTTDTLCTGNPDAAKYRFRVEGYTAWDSLDFQPIQKYEEIKSILNRHLPPITEPAKKDSLN